MKFKNFVELMLWLAAAYFPSLIGSIVTQPMIMGWYAALTKPFFNPPNWLFPPVWTFLYLTIGIAGYLVWQKRDNRRLFKTAMAVFFIQLFLNGLWSVLFFGQQQLLAAFLEIILLWIFILLTIIKFYQISKPAGLILIPYFLWVSFAALLNYSLWQLNK